MKYLKYHTDTLSGKYKKKKKRKHYCYNSGEDSPIFHSYYANFSAKLLFLSLGKEFDALS